MPQGRLGEAIYHFKFKSFGLCNDYNLKDKKNSGSATSDILLVLQSLATKLRNGFLWEALRHLVLFAQFNKREKHSWRSVTFSKVVGFSLPATLLKATLLHGCFSRFLNCTNGSKLRKASHIILNKNFKNRTIKCTAQKTSIFGIFPGAYCHASGLNTERYSASLQIHFECGKIRTRKTPNTDIFHIVAICRGAFRTLLNIYDGTFKRKKFLPKVSS